MLVLETAWDVAWQAGQREEEDQQYDTQNPLGGSHRLFDLGTR